MDTQLVCKIPLTELKIPQCAVNIPQCGTNIPRCGMNIPEVKAKIPKTEGNIPKTEIEKPRLESENTESGVLPTECERRNAAMKSKSMERSVVMTEYGVNFRVYVGAKEGSINLSSGSGSFPNYIIEYYGALHLMMILISNTTNILGLCPSNGA